MLPSSHGYNIIKTPEFCVSFVEWCTGFTHPANVTAVPQTRRFGGDGGGGTGGGAGGGAGSGVFPRGGYNWGTGRTLGTS